MHLLFFKCNCFYFKYCTVKYPIVSFVVRIRIIRNVIAVGFVLVSETIIVRLFQCNYRIVIVIFIVYSLYLIMLGLG